MATASKCGTTGSISLGGEISKWTLNLNEEAPEVTSMSSDGYKEYIGCLKDADGSFETYVPCGAVGASSAVTFTNDIDSYTMNIIITSLVCDDTVHDAVKFTYNFVSTGAIT